ncbi:MAG: hypothetical protein P1U63_10905 [Coxiellaceae bacterium]|nr:hypothetical protein [Coxiellaceae bacterium]
MMKPLDEQLQQQLLRPQPGQAPNTFYQGHRDSLLTSLSPGFLFVATTLFSYSLTTGLQDFYMPTFQNSGEKPVRSSLLEHLELPVIAAVLGVMLSATGYMLAKQAPLPHHKKQLHQRNAIAAGLGVIPGILVGLFENLSSHRSHYNADAAAAFTGIGVLSIFGFCAGCLCNCMRDLNDRPPLPTKVGTPETAMYIPELDDAEKGGVQQLGATRYDLLPPPRM